MAHCRKEMHAMRRRETEGVSRSKLPKLYRGWETEDIENFLMTFESIAHSKVGEKKFGLPSWLDY